MVRIRIFTAAPHRMLFFGGVVALNLALIWWLAILLGRYGMGPLPPAVWGQSLFHGWLLVYGAFPLFVLGFLLTALPRWVSAPGAHPREYQPVAVVLYIGLALVLAGAVSGRAGMTTGGMLVTALGLSGGFAVLVRILVQAGKPRFPDGGLATGLAGLGCLGAFLACAGGLAARPDLLRAGIHLGIWGFLTPTVFLVGHRMLPFFAGNAVPGYEVRRTRWGSPVVILLCLAQSGVLIAGWKAGLVFTALPLALVTLYHWLLWRPWQTRGEPLLWTAFAALLWLPLAGLLYGLEAGAGWLLSPVSLGRAPLHAIAVGLLGGIVLAMATRVSRGHSGRPLRMDGLDLTAFLVLQMAAVSRVVADTPLAGGHRPEWLIAGAVLWVGAFLPWGWRYGRIYWAPRVDGAPG